MSVTINTKKELFLGKRPFKAKAMTKEEFCHKVDELYDYLKRNYESMHDMRYNEHSDFSITAEKLFTISYMAEGEGIPELESYFDERDKFIGSGMEIMNWEDWPGQFEICTTDNGFTYMVVYTSVGDDAYLPMCNIIYFGQDDELHLYIPYCGNLIFVDADVQMCALGGWEGESIEELFNEAGLDYNYDFGPDFDHVFFGIYGKKYGIEGYREEVKIENLEETLDFDTDLMLEDIKSNVVLV